MTEQEIILSKYATITMIDEFSNQLKTLKTMVDNAKTEEDLNKVDTYFLYTLNTYAQQLTNKENQKHKLK